MLEQNRNLSLTDVLTMFRPAETNTTAAKGDTGFKALLDSALASLPKDAGSASPQAVPTAATAEPAVQASQTAPAPSDNPREEQVSYKNQTEAPVPESGKSDALLRSIREHAPGTSNPALTEGQGPNVVPFARRIKAREAGSNDMAGKEALAGSPERSGRDQAAKGRAQAETGNVNVGLQAATLAQAVRTGADGLRTAPAASREVQPEASPRTAVKKAAPAGSQLAGHVEAALAQTQARPAQAVATPMAAKAEQKLEARSQSPAQAKASELMAAIEAKASAGPEAKAVADAMRLVRDLGGRFGLASKEAESVKIDTPRKDGKIDLLNDRRFGRLEALRRERAGTGEMAQALDVRVTGTIAAAARVEVGQNQALPGLKSVRVDDMAGAQRESALYNPSMPQSIIHHTIQLPASVSPTPAAFSEVLRTQLRDGLNNEVVGQAKILLQGADKGEIRLILHPESLGEVKILLKLEENAIGGKIFVENKEVLEVFKDNLADLKDAFIQGGMDASGLELAVSDQTAGGRQGSFGRERRDDRAFVQYASEALDQSVPVMRFQDSNNSLIDVVV